MTNMFQKARIQAIQLYQDSVNYLKQTYNQASEMFTYASAYGQLLLVQENLTQLVLYYAQDIATEQNILQARRIQNIYGSSRLTGHNPSRGRSAVGEVQLQLLNNNNITLPGNVVYLTNYMRLQCAENGLTYVVELNSDEMVVNMLNVQNVRLKVLEGTYDSQTFQGTGEDLQTYEVNMPAGKMIDDQKLTVSINGQQCDIYDSLYDMEFGNYGCLVKTGYTTGIDIFFGKSIATLVPPNGSTITVDYLITDGSEGNFMEKDTVTMTFVDMGLDMNGNDVDMNSIFSLTTTLVPNFGSDAEDPSLTKILAPYVSRNMIIHDTKSLRYYFTKMNYFTSVKIYRVDTGDLNNFTALLVPNILDRMNSSQDYFSCPLDTFVLTSLEQTRLTEALEESGSKSANITVTITNPITRQYVAYVFASIYATYQGKNTSILDIQNQMKTAINTYMLTPRSNQSRIPSADIIAIIKGSIPQVATMKVIFLSEENEAYIVANPTIANPNLGFDDMGNILTADNEIPLLRGGWTDRSGVTYLDQFDQSASVMQSINLLLNLITS